MNANTVVSAIVFILFITGMLALVFAGEMQREVNEYEEWCNEHNGTLAFVNAFGHGGLHCDLPNGTSVHLNEVVE